MPIPTPLIAAAGLAASSAYLNARFHISKDIRIANGMRKAANNYTQAVKNRKASGFFLFQKVAHDYPDAVAVWSRERSYTWAESYALACQYGRYFLDLGVKPHTFVGVYSYNSPEFVFIWLGLMSIGAAPALINYNLASDALLHCLKVSKTKFLVYDTAPDCAARIHASEQKINALGIQTLPLSSELKNKVAQYPPTHAPVTCFQDVSKMHSFALMYTSGTTGMPKAVSLPMARHYMAASSLPKGFGQTPGPNGDRSLYFIPLYHGTGGFGVMNDFLSGISIAVVPKFSLSNFWKDCIDSQATVFVYVGEIIRFLLSAPPSPLDKQHRIRLVWGNGMSPELWSAFQDRFNVEEIGEFYSSTEGVLSMTNYYKRQGHPLGRGAVGHHGALLRSHFNNTFVPVAIDADTGEVWRDPETGFCQRTPYEQGGEILVKLEVKETWVGYFGSKAATDKKVLLDVFEKGDMYYSTGDALRRDTDGYWFFMDRLGDTFRWKGENVSTTEVTQVISTHPQIAEANVYGVKLPSHDGRAGCAAVALRAPDTADTFDWKGLAKLLRTELPAYAVPVFIRVRDGVESMSTANHKHNKVPLRLEGVDPDVMGSKVDNGDKDRVYWLPSGSDAYVPFSKQDWAVVSHARARL